MYLTTQVFHDPDLVFFCIQYVYITLLSSGFFFIESSMVKGKLWVYNPLLTVQLSTSSHFLPLFLWLFITCKWPNNMFALAAWRVRSSWANIDTLTHCFGPLFSVWISNGSTPPDLNTSALLAFGLDKSYIDLTLSHPMLVGDGGRCCVLGWKYHFVWFLSIWECLWKFIFWWKVH